MRKISEVTSSLMESAARQIGVSTGNAGAESRQISERNARARLLAQKPTETDANLLRWLESSLSVVAKPEARMMFQTTGGYYAKVTGFDIAGLTADNRSQAIDAVKAAMTPPTVDQCEEWIASLHAVCARRSDDQDTLSLVMSLYASCIAQYPADIAKEACMEFALRTAKPNWFPTLSEVNEACEKATNQRKQLLASLQA